MLVLCEIGETTFSTVVVHGNLSQRQHIAVGITAFDTILVPVLCQTEYGCDVAPFVPKVVHHAPHVGMLLATLPFIKRCGTRAHTHHDRTSALVDGVADETYLSVVVRSAEVVNLDEIDSPFRIELEDGVVVVLCSRFSAIHRVVVAQPSAERVRVVDLVAFVLTIKDRKFFDDCLLRHTTHDVNTEFQTHRMDVVGKFFETITIGSRRESLGVGHIATVFVHRIDRV